MEYIKMLDLISQELKYVIKKEKILYGLYKKQELPDEKDLFNNN